MFHMDRTDEIFTKNKCLSISYLCGPCYYVHSLGPKHRSECPPYVKELYLGLEKSDYLKCLNPGLKVNQSIDFSCIKM